MATIPRKALSPTSVEDAVEMLHEPDEVLVTIPKPFKLTDDLHAEHSYKAGVYKIPREHAEHWYARVNGVAVADISNPNV